MLFAVNIARGDFLSLSRQTERRREPAVRGPFGRGGSRKSARFRGEYPPPGGGRFVSACRKGVYTTQLLELRLFNTS